MGPASWSRSRTSLRRSFPERATSCCRCTPASKRPVCRRGRSSPPPPCCSCSAIACAGARRRRRPSAGCRCGSTPLLEGRESWLATTAELFDGADAVGVIGPASSQGLAEQAALLFREGPRMHASAHEAVDWHHTAIYTALPGYRALLLPGTRDPGRLAAVIAARGGATVAGVHGRRKRPSRCHCPPARRRFVTPAVADVLAGELRSRASGNTP